MKIDVSSLSTTIGRNLSAIAKAATHYFVDLTKHVPTIYKDKTPVLLVHGYLHNSSAWIELTKTMKQREVGSVFTINLGLPFNHSIEDYSDKVRAKAEEIRKLTGREDLILVGHSMGGVVSTHYALNHEEGKNVKKVITLGSPLKGTYLGYLGAGPCAWQMRYNSDFSNGLVDQMEKSESTDFVNIGSPSDEIILPTSSATPLQSKRVTSHQFNGIGHVAYLTAREVHDFVIDSILTSNEV